MTKFEIILAIVTILAIIIIPIVAVFVGQYLQSKSEKRKDKMQIFQCLMTKRITGWAGLDAVNALNSIDIVFSDCEAVRKQWAILLSKFRRDVTAQEQYREQCKLLELMANDLGYKDKITWDIIQNPYYPEGLAKQIEINSQILDGQVAWANAAGQFSQLLGQAPKQEEKEHADA